MGTDKTHANTYLPTYIHTYRCCANTYMQIQNTLRHNILFGMTIEASAHLICYFQRIVCLMEGT